MVIILDRVSTKRLMAYSAAAGLGAFSFGQSAEAAFVVSNVINGLHITGQNEIVSANIDGLGGNDIIILNGTRGVTFNTAPGGQVFSNKTPQSGPLAGHNYYVFGFQAGDTIDGGPYPAGGGVNLIANLTLGYHFVADGDWIGFKFDIAGSPHFAVAQVIQTSGDSEVNVGVGNSTINSTWGVILYESNPNTPMLGAPEPASLSLLALGAGAIGLRRRRKK